MSDEKTIDEQLEALEREEKDEAVARELAVKKARLARANLRRDLRAKLGGDEGSAFAIVEIDVGRVVAFKKAPGVIWKRFKKSEMNDADVEMLLRESVEQPDADGLVTILEELPAFADECLGAVAKLYGAKLEKRAKK